MTGKKQELRADIPQLDSIRAGTEFFSDSYLEARRSFRQFTADMSAELQSLEIAQDGNESLTLDVATLGPTGAPTVLVSSAVHGVEGFLGSAIQLAMIETISKSPELLSTRWVFLHAVNPFGFHFVRRFDKAGVDLNRNFLPSDDTYSGSPEGYARLNRLLNPISARSRIRPEFFRLRALVQILRFGLQPLKEAIAGGQYDFPDGLFYGGSEPSRSHQVIAEHCGDWIGASNDIIHIDIHSGLGAHATYKLLLANDIDEEARLWHTNTFGPDVVEFNTTEKRKTAYTIRGEFGQWMRNRFSDRRYRFALAEFGTYNNIRVLQAMRNENRMYHFSDHESIHYRRARAELLECFCPASVSWRNQVVMSGTQICLHAWAAIGR